MDSLLVISIVATRHRRRMPKRAKYRTICSLEGSQSLGCSVRGPSVMLVIYAIFLYYSMTILL